MPTTIAGAGRFIRFSRNTRTDMIHMLSCFDLAEGTDLAAFRAGYGAFFDEMKAAGLAEETGPIGERERNTPMDTDDERDHQYFVVMGFRDRAQIDAAYAHIERHVAPGEDEHNGVMGMVQNPVFICWRDTE